MGKNEMEKLVEEIVTVLVYSCDGERMNEDDIESFVDALKNKLNESMGNV